MASGFVVPELACGTPSLSSNCPLTLPIRDNSDARIEQHHCIGLVFGKRPAIDHDLEGISRIYKAQR
jgi:hypothetical protein